MTSPPCGIVEVRNLRYFWSAYRVGAFPYKLIETGVPRINSMKADKYNDKGSSTYELKRGIVPLPAETATMVDNAKE